MNFTKEQKEFIVSLVAVILCFGFVIGYAACIFINRPTNPPGEIAQRNSCIDLMARSSSWRYTLCNTPMDSIQSSNSHE